MNLDDGKPWFRRWMWIGFRPIHPAGTMVIAVMNAVILGAVFSLFLVDPRSVWFDVIFAAAFVTVVIGYVVIFWKLEQRF